MTAVEQLEVLTDFVEGTINDYVGGLTELDEAVKIVTKYFLDLMFEIEEKWADDILELSNSDSSKVYIKSQVLLERSLKIKQMSERMKGGTNG